ncbi:MAG: hypothetical protein UV60_C0015G0013 [Parcubacteria group bacterium GW2011_GWA2_43_11]|nr:MAG: hypothetical protein UV60_C0015G0013 [Parcubacteria group bacterium GW2011_GWA2_43_11]
MNSIKIVKAPNISDPEIRRLQLVGLVLPLPSNEILKQAHNISPAVNTYVVFTEDVIRRLKKEDKKSAVEYWSAKSEKFMVFNADDCQVIS